MEDAWQILRDGGLPLAIEGTGTRRTAEELAAATSAAIASGPSGRAADALAAYILAWYQHWPETFASAFEADAAAVCAWAATASYDPDRYLKLRRIALENLAKVI